MTLFESTLLGVTQGLTEFFPVSSSGHLVILQYLFSLTGMLQFDIFLHFATLFALLTYFRKEVAETAKGVFGKSTEGLYYLKAVIIGSIPTALIGFLFKDFFEEKFSQPKIVMVSLIITGFILWLSSLSKKSEVYDKKPLLGNYTDFLLIGIVQGIAIMPGISRSGITISTALLLGFNRQWAFKYSMLLSIPAILGASLMEIKNLAFSTTIVSGGIAGFITGFFALFFLSRIITNNKFHYFSYYLWAIGTLGFILLK